MSGFQEILVVAVIVLAVVFIPRIRSGQRQLQAPTRTALRLSGKLRIAVAASFVYVALAAAILQPWQGDPIRYLYIGLGPVALGWLLYWVFRGFRRR